MQCLIPWPSRDGKKNGSYTTRTCIERAVLSDDNKLHYGDAPLNYANFDQK